MMHLLNFVLLAVAATGSLAAPIDPASSVGVVSASGPIAAAAAASGVPTSIVTLTSPLTRIPSASATVTSAIFASGPITTVVASPAPIHQRDVVSDAGRLPTTAIVGDAVDGVLGAVPVPQLGARQLTSSLLSAAPSLPTTVVDRVPASVSTPCPMSDAEGVTTFVPRQIITSRPPTPPRPSVAREVSIPPVVSSVPSAAVPRDVTDVPSALPTTLPAAVPLPPLNRAAAVPSVPHNVEFQQVGPVTPSLVQPPSVTTQIRI